MSGTEAAADQPAWHDRYHRALLSHLGVDTADVDMSSISATSEWERAWSYSEYTGGDAQFSLTVNWRSSTPRGDIHEQPDEDGLYTHQRGFTNEEVADFLNNITDY